MMHHTNAKRAAKLDDREDLQKNVCPADIKKNNIEVNEAGCQHNGPRIHETREESKEAAPHQTSTAPDRSRGDYGSTHSEELDRAAGT